jgi:hypothetical protein
MSMPGFRAEASLHSRGSHYGSYRSSKSAVGVVPQLQTQTDLASSCWRICQCCKRGNRFCCSHCRWCSGPIGAYVTTQY